MNPGTENILINRYPGIKPFSEKEQSLFFGRESDIKALNSLIFIKQVVVLYGKSGYGKSSLINAGIIPELKQNDSWIYFSIRFNNYSKQIGQSLSPTQTVKQRFTENITVDTQSSFYQLIPDEGSFWYWIKLNQLNNRKHKFIIFFDQFEELFTYSKEDVSEFSEHLSQLLYNTVPGKFRKKISELDEGDGVSESLHDFLNDKPEIKVVFSIRSDRLSLMNVLTDRHPSILQNCYELNALKTEDAIAAIIEPAKLPVSLGFKTPTFTFSTEVIDKILQNIADPLDKKIDAATLQIVCRHVEDSIVNDLKFTEITENLLGDITDIFRQYYESILNKLPQEERIKGQKLLEDELSDGSRRNTLSAGFIQNRLGVSANVLEVFEQSSLLRKERNASGTLLYEISHDSLVNAIGNVAHGRRKSEDEIKKKELEQQIIEERKRSDQLIRLNKRAKNRTKISLTLAFFCVAIAVFAWHMANEAQEKKYEAEKASARLYIEKGDSFLDDDFKENKNNIIEAKLRYEAALEYIIHHREDTLYNLIKDKINACDIKLK